MNDEEVNIIEYLSIIKKRIKLVIIVFLSFVIFSIIYALIAKKTYISDASILPSFEESRTASFGAFSGLASNLGLSNLPSKSNSQLYPEIFRSRPIIFSLLEKSFKNFDNNNETLLDLLKIEENSREKRLQKGYKIINKIISTNVNDRTGVVNLSVETDKNWLSKEIADALIELFIEYNKNTITSKAKENRIFIEKQLKKTENEFNRAEEELTEHRNKNRSIDDSPELQRERGRLLLDYDMGKTNYISFKNEFEMAVLQEVKDTPVINILNTPIISQYKSRPNRRLIVIVASFMGIILGVFGAFGLEYYYNSYKKL